MTKPYGTEPLSVYSRDDMSRLKTADRAVVFAALRSTDDRDLSDEAFARKTLDLLDPGRVPGLDEALAADDLPRALETVRAACSGQAPAETSVPTELSVRLANDALGNRFTFYGETHQLAADMDWEFNPGTAHWGHDLHRFSYLSALGQVFLATGDVRYAKKAKALVLDWIAKCDFGRSFIIEKYAFGSYLNLAIHAKSWSQVTTILTSRGQVDAMDLLRILKSLHDHLAYLEIVTNGHGGNWPTIGCMGMLATLEWLPFFRDTDRFVGYCRETLARQIADQVLPDGVQDELTPHYHQVVVNNLIGCRRSLLALGSDIDAATLATLRKMIHYSQQTIVPDGSKQVAFNDSDPGAVPRLHDTLAAAGLTAYLRPEEDLGPEVFPYAGVAFLRQRRNRGDLYLAFDAGPFGRSHQHEDKLGFWLFAYGRNFLVDPGRHLYDWSEVSFYPYLIGTRAHSTVLVDGHGQNSRSRRDTWIAREPLDLDWTIGDDEIRARGIYDLGYGPDNAVKVSHCREIVFIRERCWIVFDTLTGDDEHTIESRFQFAPGNLMAEGPKIRTDFPDANLLLWPSGAMATAEARIEAGCREPRAGWYSDGVNKIEPAPALSLTRRGPLPMGSATLLFPYRGTVPPAIDFAFDGVTAMLCAEDTGELRIRRSGRRC